MKTTKVTVTALKAPWPEGVQLGHVVSFKGEPPAWAQGKFTEAPEGAKTDFAYEPPELVGDSTGAALPSVDAVNAEIADLQTKLAAAADGQAKAQEEAKAEKARADDLQTKLAAAADGQAKAQEEAKAEKARADDLQTKLAAAEAAAQKASKKP